MGVRWMSKSEEEGFSGLMNFTEEVRVLVEMQALEPNVSILGEAVSAAKSLLRNAQRSLKRRGGGKAGLVYLFVKVQGSGS